MTCLTGIDIHLHDGGSLGTWQPPVLVGHPSTGIPDTTSMTVEQRSSATVISTSMAPATGPTDPRWAGVPSARIGGPHARSMRTTTSSYGSCPLLTARWTRGADGSSQ